MFWQSFFKNEENKTIEIALSHSDLKLSSNVRTKGTNSEKKRQTHQEHLKLVLSHYTALIKNNMYFQHTNSCACSTEREHPWRPHNHN